MLKISEPLNLILKLSRLQSILTRRFDGALGGLSMNEFMILYNLSIAKDQKLKRIDLANKIGLTASGITRLLVPMEKIGLVKREINIQDARCSYVSLASGGKRKLGESITDAELLSKELLQDFECTQVEEVTKFIAKLYANPFI